jgi:hypothetical protein
MELVVVKLQEWIALHALKVIAAIIILLFGRFADKGIRAIIQRMLQKGHVDDTLVSFVSTPCYSETSRDDSLSPRVIKKGTSFAGFSKTEGKSCG